jgi:two-component system chemotaxis sensor kinase CheA
MQDLDVVREFLSESDENLSRLEVEIVQLEKQPNDKARLASVFRTIHTIKGTCGFLGFGLLEKLTHQAENVLSQLRDGKRELSVSLISLILATVDATRRILASIEATGSEGGIDVQPLIERLRAASLLDQESAGGPPQAAIPVDLDEASAEGSKGATADGAIRVGVNLLDKLMDLVGELVLTRNQILQFNAEREDPALNITSQRLNLITTELQEGVMKTRMQPIGTVWNKLPRVVRDIALSLGKQIRIDLDGADTELDRTIIEAIKDPLVHLVRNACDHGIEKPEARVRDGKPAQGRLGLRAYHEGGQVNIEIGDDGAGIDVEVLKQKAVTQGFLRPEAASKMSDREALNLIFHAGFSTAKAVTNISGRGVGMDVVRSNIEKIGGTVDLVSRRGEGLTVKLKIPLTLAIIPGLVITSGGERFVIPQVSLLELVRLETDSADKRVEYVHGAPVYRRRGSLLPVAWLNQVLGLKAAHEGDVVSMVVLQAEDRQFGLVVDGINDTQEIVVKPLGKQLKGVPVYAGATIMGDGRVSLILDVLGVGLRSGVLSESREQTRATTDRKAEAETEMQRLLLFSAGTFHRIAVPLSLVARLEEFPRSAIERAGGHDVVQYRNRILPLISLRMVLDSQTGSIQADPAQVIVFNDGERSLGIEVDQILDIAEDAVTVRRRSKRKGLLGSAVVGKEIADFLDLHYVIQGAGADWFDRANYIAGHKCVLVAEASAFSRGLIRGGLDMAGYGVLEASSLEEALAAMERHSVDIVVTAADLPPEGSAALAQAMKRRPECAHIPMLNLAGDAEFEREAMLDSIAKLAEAVGHEHSIPEHSTPEHSTKEKLTA